MVRPIVEYGNPVLRTPGKKIDKITDEIRQLARDMIETMREAKGVGLAAQQVGEALQICVLEVPDCEERPSRLRISAKDVELEEHMPMILVNPELRLSKEKVVGAEGCLSFPEIHADIRRPASAKVTATDLDGNEIKFDCWGLLSRAVQHEVDHLKGILFIDRMDAATKSSLKGEIQALAEKRREKREESGEGPSSSEE